MENGSPIRKNIKDGYLDIVKYLVEKGAHPSSALNSGRFEGETPIYLAANFGHLDIVQYLVENGVKALIIRVNSPGGGVAASQEIYQHIARVKEENNILIVSAFSAVAASGGYYVALDSDFIFANPGSVVGSIGVIMSYPILEEMLGYIGINQETIKSFWGALACLTFLH